MPRPGYRLAACATCLALLVVLLGAYTRLTHAGLGCPDWPGCYGLAGVPGSPAQLAHAELHFPDHPVEAAKGWAEMLHRYFAGALTLVIFMLALQACRVRTSHERPWCLPLGLVGMVLAQAVFGMWTVTLRLWPQVVVVHLLGGFTTLSLLLLLSLRLSGAFAPGASRCKGLQRLALLGLLVVIGQIALGGWVSANYAAVACIDLPTCHGQWWPAADFANGFHLAQRIGPNYLGGQLDSEARTAIHLTHRAGALVVLGVLGLLSWKLVRHGLAGLACLVAGMLLVQLGLGLANVLLHVPLPIALAHSAGGALLLMVMVVVNYRIGLGLLHRSQAQRGWSVVVDSDVGRPRAGWERWRRLRDPGS
ncbi:COX15/CtaA family protein [Pseudomonas fulva]|nr:COX15/CtaA family protein [Pseudomonas fulva]MBF8778708.1 COX15/CtaA family protein [Pseudomonas fulva]